MANTSIYNAFERMWQHTNDVINNNDKVLVVTADTTNNAASHSASEIKAAHDAGKLVVLDADGKMLNLYTAISNFAGFIHGGCGSSTYNENTYIIDNNKNLTVSANNKNFLPESNENTNGKYLRSTSTGGEWVDLPSYATMDEVNSAISTAITSAIGGSY